MSASAERDRTAFVGTVFALATLAMLFTSLLFSYAVVRYHAPVWPADGARVPRALPAAGALVLLASSAVLWRGSRRALVILLGVAFLGLQATAGIQLRRSGLTIGSGITGSVVHAFLGLHALLAVAGLTALAAARRDETRRRLAAMLWHFVVLVWLVLFVAVWLL